MTNENAPAVAAISARLHGMPLAIELAAARIKLLSPDAILARLEHQLDVLAAGAARPAGPPADAAGAIAWSYDLLDDGGRAAARPAVGLRQRLRPRRRRRRICGPAAELGGDIVDGLMALADQSLLKVEEAADGEPRFRLLDTIREYAAERLDGARRDGARSRPATATGSWPSPSARRRSCPAPTSGAGSTASSSSTTTSGPSSTGPSAAPDPPVAIGARLRDVALLAEARPPGRGAPAARGDGGRSLVARRSRASGRS